MITQTFQNLRGWIKHPKAALAGLVLPAVVGGAGADASTSDGVTITDFSAVEFWAFEDLGTSVGDYDPVLFVEPGQAYPYHMLVVGGGGQDLYRSTDMRSWELVKDNVRDQNNAVITAGNGTNFNWGRKVGDTYYLFQSRGDTSTHLYTSTDLTTLTYHGLVLNESDTGGYYEAQTGTWHTYFESGQIKGPSGNALGHATSTDAINWTVQPGFALDLGPAGENKKWYTGDADVIKINDTYHMFIDNTINHPDYRIAWATSTDLYNWELREDAITHWPGGDASVRYLEQTNEFIMYQEFRGTGSDRTGVGFARAPISGGSMLEPADPSMIGGLVLWLRDADKTYDAGAQDHFDGIWRDSSGQGNDLTAFAGRSSTSVLPQDIFGPADTDPAVISAVIDSPNGPHTIHALRFSADADELMKSDLLAGDNDDDGIEGAFSNITIFSVLQIEQSSVSSEVRPYGLGSWRDTDGNNTNHLNMANDGSLRKDNGNFNESDEKLPIGEFFIRITRMTAGDDIDEWLVVQQGPGLDLFQTRGGAFITSDDDFFLGDLRTDADYQSGDGFAVAEILVYNESLTDAQIAGIAAYLDDKYLDVVPEPTSLIIFMISGWLATHRTR